MTQWMINNPVLTFLAFGITALCLYDIIMAIIRRAKKEDEE